MGGVIAADVATYYGPELIGGVVLLGSFPHRNMLGDVATPWIVGFVPRLLDPDLAKFGPTVKEFVESCVAFGDKLNQLIKYSWMGAIAGQNPDVRAWSFPHTQNETALMNVRATIPYLALHGNIDKLVDGVKLRAYMDKYFGNFAFRYLTDVGHAFFWDAPAEANQEIVAFAKRLSQVSISLSGMSCLKPVRRVGLRSAVRPMGQSTHRPRKQDNHRIPQRTTLYPDRMDPSIYVN
jgi:pimeloyl-ACP methyl ester carboxylesterase